MDREELSLLMKNEQPVGIAVPLSGLVFTKKIQTQLAIGLFIEGKVGLAGAARIAGISASEMMDILSGYRISMSDISKEELMEELGSFE